MRNFRYFYLDKKSYFFLTCPFKLYFYLGSHVQLEPVSSRAAWSATTAARWTATFSGITASFQTAQTAFRSRSTKGQRGYQLSPSLVAAKCLACRFRAGHFSQTLARPYRHARLPIGWNRVVAGRDDFSRLTSLSGLSSVSFLKSD